MDAELEVRELNNALLLYRVGGVVLPVDLLFEVLD